MSNETNGSRPDPVNMAEEIRKAIVGSRIPAYFYSCEECCLIFAVEQAFDDQSAIQCPVCLTDEHLHDAGSGEMVIQTLPDDTDPDLLDK